MGEDDPTKPFNSATVVYPVSAAVRERLDAVALTRMEEFARDVQDFFYATVTPTSLWGHAADGAGRV